MHILRKQLGFGLPVLLLTKASPLISATCPRMDAENEPSMFLVDYESSALMNKCWQFTVSIRESNHRGRS